MHGWLGCLLLLLVTTTNAAGEEHDLTEIRAEMRSIRLELDAVKIENTALSTRLRAIEPATMADPADATISHDTTATISHDERDSNSARRLTGQDSVGSRASVKFDGTTLEISSPLHVNGSITAAGAISGASVAASGAVSGASVAASGAVSGASVTASGAVSGSSLTSTGAVTVGGDLTISGNIYPSTVIAFSAYSSISTVTTGNPLPFNNAKANLGSAYSTSTYTFTAPVDGVYQFSVDACGSQAYSRIEFLINNAWDGVNIWGDSLATKSFTIIRQLSAGNTVKPYAGGSFSGGGSTTIYMSSGGVSISSFSGHLLAAT